MTSERDWAATTRRGDEATNPTLVLADTVVPDAERPPPRDRDDDPADPPTIGRYRVTGRLGAGAMGVVYAAHDEALDRAVAVKLMHRDEAHPRRGERLLREAQAMAKLSHPNVAQVYEAGIHEAQVFIAMEQIRGTTLRGWLDAAERPWPAIVERFVAAGRGLAAAHAAGVVHRDFKPDNVLVGDDGRVVVVDFGVARLRRPLRLAQGTGSTTGDRDAEHGDAEHGDGDGDIVGTPAYMSPEQWLGGPVDPRSDQFSLCAALFEALHRRRPFAGDTAVELARNVLSGTRAPPPRPRRCPRWLDPILARGLDVHPARRFATLADLLAALTRDRLRRRRRWLAATAGVALAAVLGFGASALRDHDPCAAAGDRIAAVWSPERRAALERTVLGGARYAAASWPRIDAHLDAYAGAWARGAREACAATRVRGEASEDLLDRRAACLGARSRALDAVVATFEHEGDAALERAVETLAGLPPIDPCNDADYVRASIPPPATPTAAAAVEALRDRLAAVRARYAVTDRRRSLDELAALEREAAALDYRPLLAEAQALHGRTLLILGDPAAAELLTRAYHSAIASGHDEVALETALTLVTASPHDSGGTWLVVAEALLERLRAGDELRARLHYVRLYRACRDGVCDEPVEPLRAAIDRHRRGVGDDDPAHAGMLIDLANIHMLRAESAEAERVYAEALALHERILGPTHPSLIRSLGNLARLALGREDFATAAAHIRRAGQILDGWSPSHPYVLGLRVLEADLAYATGDLEQTVDILARSIAATPRDTPQLATLRFHLAEVRRLLGDRHAALAALELEVPSADPDLHLEFLAHAALLTAELGDVAAARGHLAAAGLRLDTPHLPVIEWTLAAAEARVAATDAERRAAAERLEARLAGDLPPAFRAELSAALARLLAATDPARARTLAADADAAYAAAGAPYARLRREFAAWRATLPP